MSSLRITFFLSTSLLLVALAGCSASTNRLPDALIDAPPPSTPDAPATDDDDASTTPDAPICGATSDCEDLDACTIDRCATDGCVHTPIDCDDGIACTFDGCAAATGCTHTLDDTRCGAGRSCAPSEPDADIDGCVLGAPCTTATDCADSLFCTDDVCDTTTHRCTHVPHVCPEDDNPCTAGFACDESTNACVPTFAPSTVLCNASRGDCDRPEFCTGTSATCPADTFVPVGTTCRVSRGDCDEAEKCTGSSPTCPSDMPAADGTPCDLRCGNESCSGGACVGGTTCSALRVCLCDDVCGNAGDDCP